MISTKFYQTAIKSALGALRSRLAVWRGRFGRPVFLAALLGLPLLAFALFAGPAHLLSPAFALALCPWLAGIMPLLWLHIKGKLPVAPGVTGEFLAIAQLVGMAFTIYFIFTGPVDESSTPKPAAVEYVAMLALALGQIAALMCTRSAVLFGFSALFCFAALPEFAGGVWSGLLAAAGALLAGRLVLSYIARLAAGRPRLAVAYFWVIGLCSLGGVYVDLELPTSLREFYVIDACLIAATGAVLVATGRWWLLPYAAPFGYRFLARPFESIGAAYIVGGLLLLATKDMGLRSGPKGELSEFTGSVWLSLGVLLTTFQLALWTAYLVAWLHCSIRLVQKRDYAVYPLLAAPLLIPGISLPYLSGASAGYAESWLYAGLMCLLGASMWLIGSQRRSKAAADAGFYALILSLMVLWMLFSRAGIGGLGSLIAVALIALGLAAAHFGYLRRMAGRSGDQAL